MANVTVWGQTIHEFAHVIDFNHGGNFTFDVANNAISAFNAGDYGDTNRFENYAESVGIWVYGQPFATEIGAAGALPPTFSDFYSFN